VSCERAEQKKGGELMAGLKFLSILLTYLPLLLRDVLDFKEKYFGIRPQGCGFSLPRKHSHCSFHNRKNIQKLSFELLKLIDENFALSSLLG
jgi:hypothetical protein